MLSVSQISKSYAMNTVLQDVSFTLNPGERVGLIGPNGCGKTTLLRIIAGMETPDSGGVHRHPPSLPTGYLPQGFEPDPQETLGSFLRGGEASLDELGEQLEELASELASTPGQADLQQTYDRVLTHLQAASQEAGQVSQVLASLGLGELPLDTPTGNLSGGQKTRLSLARVLLSNPALLLLDEPTNHLDLQMLRWLEDWLLSFHGGVLLVSHDRFFLDTVCTAILELDEVTHTTRLYAGNYSVYQAQKLAEYERGWQDYKDQQDEIARLREAAAHLRGAARFRKGGKADTPDKFAKGFFANRARGTVARAKHIEKRLQHLMTDERIEKPRATWQMKLDFRDMPTSGRAVLSLEGVAVGYGEKPLLQNINLHMWHSARVALIGPNGSGKTTLLRTITGALDPLAGSLRLGANVRLGYMAQEQESLDPSLDAFSTVRRLAPFSETEARQFLHEYLFSGDEVFTPIGKLSFGERARLSLACLVASGCNLLILDEPVNHLDIPSRLRFEEALSGFDGTILVVSHDRYFIQGYASEIWEVDIECHPPTIVTWIP